MKKVLNIAFWLSIIILIIVLAYTIYIRIRPAQLQVLPGNENSRNSMTQKNSDVNEAKEKSDADENTTNGSDDEGGTQPVKAPDFELESIGKNRVRLSDYEGEIVFLNFWALSCPYCLAEMPELDKAHKELAGEDLGVVLTVNLGDDHSRVEQYLEEEGLSLPVLLDTNGQVGRIYGVSGIPITFVINRDGTVYGYLAGSVDKKTIMEIAYDLAGAEEAEE